MFLSVSYLILNGILEQVRDAFHMLISKLGSECRALCMDLAWRQTLSVLSRVKQRFQPNAKRLCFALALKTR